MIQQNLTQKQGLKILPQQIQLLNFFRLNQLELEHRIQQELEENPLLEKGDDAENTDSADSGTVEDFKDYDEFMYDDIPDYKLEYANYLPEDTSFQSSLADSVDFRDEAKQQFRMIWIDDKDWKIADFIIDSLNDYGMLEQSLEEVAENYSFKNGAWVETDELASVLTKIQQLEPYGLGAADTRECLLIQLERMNTKQPDVKVAITLLRDYYDEMKGANMDKICQRLGIDEEELKIVLHLISTLKMRPVTESAKAATDRQKIIPDFIVRLDGDKLEVELYNSRSSTLHINTSWKESVEAQCEGKQQKEAKVYLRNKLQSAQWFIDAIRQRETNMLQVMKTIVKLQHEYFKEGDIRMLKPMILKNVADMVNLDISTISRITSNKYAETSFGTLLLKDLFTEGLVNEKGESTSNRVIQSTIEEVIRQEDKKHPLTDQQLVTILAEKGYSIARRTVAKYRELLQIPVAHLRGIWS
ncbi:MAG: RNA polymerase factor sigma-54 [Flavitalea sp.]